ncbi:MAG: hypothetical protein ACRDPS_24635 [Nocardioides sp.]|uniref:hypothetical protein n=1 Tax=Nocardioides sp. TaxID=35761 RepID=UPI003D6A8B4A
MKARSSTPDRGRLRAAWTLVLLTVCCAELSFTAVAVPKTWLLLPLLLVMYGAGVLLIREAAVRVGAGWPSLVLLGVAYELAEDGIGLQALTSPEMYGAADWGWRLGGANLTYWASQLGVHVVFSVLVPILLIGLIFPSHRGRPFLRRGGLIVVGVLAVLGVVGLRVVISSILDPGYRAPLPWIVAFVVAIAVLAWIALRVVPRVPVPAPTTLAPRPVVVGLTAAAATYVFLLLTLPLALRPGSDPLLGEIVPAPVPIVLAAAVAYGIGWTIRRWSVAPTWSDQHWIWMVGGILVAHTAFMMPASWVAMGIGSVTITVEVALLVLLARRVGSS